jgi:hypothetical protein
MLAVFVHDTKCARFPAKLATASYHGRCGPALASITSKCKPGGAQEFSTA